MTRIQKYEVYRQEIAQGSLLSLSNAQDDKTIQKYEKAINKISPFILTSNPVEPISFESGFKQTDLEKTQISSQIVNMFNDLNAVKVETTVNDIKALQYDLINENILDQQGHIKESWINQHSSIPSFKRIEDRVNEVVVTNQATGDDLQTKYNNLAKQAEEQQPRINTKLDSKKAKSASSYVFAISLSIAILAGVIILILIMWKVIA